MTGVCSATNLNLVKSLGAEPVIDYTAAEFSARTGRYDVIFDVVAKFPKSGYARLLAPGGAYITMARLDSKESMDNLLFIKALIEAGELKAVIDRCYLLEEIVAAHRYVDTGRKKGDVVITVTRNDERGVHEVDQAVSRKGA